MPTELKDAIGQTHRAQPAARIVSLVPSLTELLFDLGLADRLVGRTRFCVHPAPAVSEIASVGGTKEIDMARLLELAPTHVLVNVDENPKEMADAIAAEGIQVVVTHPLEVVDNRELYRLLGGLFGADAAAAGLEAAFEAAFDRLAAAARDWPARRALYLIWRKPWMTVAPGTYIADMLNLANIANYDTGDGLRYPEIEMSDALLDAVDLVLFSTEPYPFAEKHLAAFHEAFPRHAAKARLIDAEMVSWYGSRAVSGLDYLAEFGQELDRDFRR
jgi:ABC-type Fe3+-hydroxamate transport system substrate-binding protein